MIFGLFGFFLPKKQSQQRQIMMKNKDQKKPLNLSDVIDYTLISLASCIKNYIEQLE